MSRTEQRREQGMPFAVSAHWYDALYHWKDYEGESRRIVERIRGHNPDAQTLLDLACGTGMHASLLSSAFAVEGLDVQPDLLAAARKRAPNILFHEGDMRDFQLTDGSGQTRRFDAITCLFSSIGYLETLEDITHALRSMAAHLAPGGLLLVEPWLQPDVFIPGKPHMLSADLPDLKVCRMSEARVEGALSIIDFYYQVAEGNRVYRTEECHRLRLSTVDELLGCFDRAGLNAQFTEDGLMPERGLYLAVHK